jgi:putative ABC transport system permease protein
MSEHKWPGLRRVFRIAGIRQVQSDVSDELGFHIQGRSDELVAGGMARDEAESEARRRFGDYRRIESEVERFDRDVHRRRTMADRFDALRIDLRYTIRMLRRQPIFAVVVIATLTLGISATAAIYHAVDRIVLHPLPYPHPERIVYLGWNWERGNYANALSPRKFEFWQKESRAFEGIATSKGFEAVVGDDATGPTARGMRITAGYLDVIGMRPVLGRAFSKEEFTSAAPQVAILSQALWMSQFGGDRAAIGRSIRLDGHPYTVIGVMPASFEVAESTEWAQVLVPLVFTPEQLADGGNNYTVIARLRAEVSPTQIDADMGRVFADYRAAYPETSQKDDRGVRLQTYQNLFVGGLSSTLWIMLGATAFVLVLACANVTNLLLARSLSRQREFAVRTALGAGRGRIARQVVLEMVVLGVIAAFLATAASLAGVRAIVALASGSLLRESQLRLDPRVLVFTTLTALAASLIVGMIVSLVATRVDLTKSLASGARGSVGGKRQTMVRSVLVSTESAIAMILLVGAGLLIASFARLNAVDPGFQREGIFTAVVSRAPSGYDSAATVWQFEQRVLDRLRATPGISGAAAAFTLPLQRGWNLPMTLEGRPDATEGGMEWRSISPSYFQTMGVRLITGRDITESDKRGAPLVAIISQSFAKRYWPNQSPIGQRLLLGQYKGKSIGPGFDEPPREIIGVVPDLRDMSLDQTRPRSTVWVPQAQVPPAMVKIPAFIVRATDAGLAADALRHAIAETDPRMRAPDVAAMTDIVSQSLSWRRFTMVLMTVFALLALTLTCIGIYGVVAYAVAQRTHEIGVRIALGARPGSVVALVVRQGMRPVVIGLLVGLAGALALSRVLTTMLYGVGPRDPLSLSAVAVVLATVAFVASYVPARRASRVDPLKALRAD